MGEEQPKSMAVTTFAIRGDTIGLGQLLKASGQVASGAQVKEFLLEAKIRVNGEPESRRGRKIRPGDVILLPSGDQIGIVCDS